MAEAVANVVITTDTFNDWLTRQNEVAHITSNRAVTTFANTIGATTAGNAYINGFVAATVLAAPTMRGGNVQSSGLLTITSNTTFSGGQVNSSANVYIQSANLYVNTTVTTLTGTLAGVAATFSGTVDITDDFSVGTTDLFVDDSLGRVGIANGAPDSTLTVGGTSNVAGNTWIGDRFKVLGIANIEANTTFGNNVWIVGDLDVTGTLTSSGQAQNSQQIGNTLFTSNTTVFNTATADQVADQYALASYRTVKYTYDAVDDLTTDRMSGEVILTHNGSVSFISEYGRIETNANVGGFGTDVNGGNVRLLWSPTTTDSTVKLVIHRVDV